MSSVNTIYNEIIDDWMLSVYRNNFNENEPRNLIIREKIRKPFKKYQQIFPTFTFRIYLDGISDAIDIPSCDVIAWLGDVFIYLNKLGDECEIEYLSIRKMVIRVPEEVDDND